MKPWVTTTINNNCEQLILIQPNPTFNGIEIYIQEANGANSSNALYIEKEELPIIIQKLQEMMDYVTTK